MRFLCFITHNHFVSFGLVQQFGPISLVVEFRHVVLFGNKLSDEWIWLEIYKLINKNENFNDRRCLLRTKIKFIN